MPKMKLTKRAIDELAPGPSDAFYWDTDITGLALKVTPKGKKSFLVQYRPGGRGTPTRKFSLGQYGPVTLHKARAGASRVLGLRADGRDPALERQQAKRISASSKFSDVADEFLSKHAAQNRTAKETARIVTQYVLPHWKNRSIHEIGKRDINALLDVIVARGSPVMANRTLAAVRKLFNWSVSRGIISVSPCAGIKRRLSFFKKFVFLINGCDTRNSSRLMV